MTTPRPRQGKVVLPPDWQPETPPSSRQGAVRLEPDELEPGTPVYQHEEDWGDAASGLDVAAALLPRRRPMGLLGWGLTTMAGLGLVETGLFVWQQLMDNLLLGVAWAGAVALVSLGASGSVLREWRLLRRLRRRQDARARSESLLAEPGLGEGRAFCEQLARETGLLNSESYQRWLADIDSHHDDAELLRLYSRQVLSTQDALAHACVSRWSGEAAVLVAISPLASVDMLLILWRNLKMVEGIARCYGIRLGYWSRVQLLRQIGRHMLYAGAAELITDVGLDWLGAELSAKLSARLAQGVGAGLLTARLGIQTMQLCRPIAFALDERPRLGQVRGELLKQLTSRLGAVLSRSGNDG